MPIADIIARRMAVPTVPTQDNHVGTKVPQVGVGCPDVPTCPDTKNSFRCNLKSNSPNVQPAGESAALFSATASKVVGTGRDSRDNQDHDRLVAVPTPEKPVGTRRDSSDRPQTTDRCRHCGELIGWPAAGGVTFADGAAAHTACYERAEIDRLLDAGLRAVAPELVRDEAEVTLRGELP